MTNDKAIKDIRESIGRIALLKAMFSFTVEENKSLSETCKIFEKKIEELSK